MQKNKTAIALMFLCGILIYFSCKKSDSVTNRIQSETEEIFFTLTGNVNPVTKAISENIKKQNDKKHFVNDLVKHSGFPHWDKAKVITKPTQARGQDLGDANKIVYIPFSPSTYDMIGAILIIGINGADTSFQMLYHWDYSRYSFTETPDSVWNARDIFNLFADFEYGVFGHTEFMLRDNRIFGLTDTNYYYQVTRMPDQTSGRGVEIEYCIHYAVCKVRKAQTLLLVKNSVVPADCEEFTVCSTYYITYDDDPPLGGPGSNGGSNGGGGNGGGGGGPTPNPYDYNWFTSPCSGEITGPISGPNTGICGGHAGWLGLESLVSIGGYEFDDTEDPTLAQQATCFANFLATNFNKDVAAKKLRKMFQSGNVASPPIHFNFTFSLNSSLVDSKGQPTPGHSDITTMPDGSMNVSIKLNPTFWYNPRTSNQFISSVILHELLHVFYFAYRSNIPDSQLHESMVENLEAGWIYDGLKELYPNDDVYHLLGLALRGFSDYFEDKTNPGQVDPVIASHIAQKYFGISIPQIYQWSNNYINNNEGDQFCQ